MTAPVGQFGNHKFQGFDLFELVALLHFGQGFDSGLYEAGQPCLGSETADKQLNLLLPFFGIAAGLFVNFLFLGDLGIIFIRTPSIFLTLLR